MKVIFDTTILLQDFLYRFEEPAKFRTPDEVHRATLQSYRAVIHRALEKLSLIPSFEAFLPEFCLMRMAAILSDYKVENEIVKEELHYLFHNFQIIPSSGAVLHDFMNSEQTDFDAEEYMLWSAAVSVGCQYFISAQPKGKKYLGELRWINPEAVDSLLEIAAPNAD